MIGNQRILLGMVGGQRNNKRRGTDDERNMDTGGRQGGKGENKTKLEKIVAN